MELREILPGDIFWVDAEASASGSGAPHPYVVVETQPHGQTVAACALTSNPRRAGWPGNVQLEAGEGGLPRASVVEVSKQVTLEVSRLGAHLGRLEAERVEQIRAGIRFVQRLRGDGEEQPREKC